MQPFCNPAYAINRDGLSVYLSGEGYRETGIPMRIS
jgi:hypothetical protein